MTDSIGLCDWAAHDVVVLRRPWASSHTDGAVRSSVEVAVAGTNGARAVQRRGVGQQETTEDNLYRVNNPMR